MYDDSYVEFRNRAPEVWVRWTILDEDLKDWMWTLVRGNFTVEEIDGFLVRLNLKYASTPQADRLSIIAQMFCEHDPLDIEDLPPKEQHNIDRIVQELRKKGYSIW